MTTLTPKSAAPEASASSPAFVVAIWEGFDVLGYVGHGEGVCSRRFARRFEDQPAAESAALSYERMCGSSLYCTIRQEARA